MKCEIYMEFDKFWRIEVYDQKGIPQMEDDEPLCREANQSDDELIALAKERIADRIAKGELEGEVDTFQVINPGEGKLHFGDCPSCREKDTVKAQYTCFVPLSEDYTEITPDVIEKAKYNGITGVECEQCETCWKCVEQYRKYLDEVNESNGHEEV